MDTMTDLLKLRFVFSQQPLLTTDEFLKECMRRASPQSESIEHREQLEAFHRLGILVPIFRLRKKMRLPQQGSSLSDNDKFNHWTHVNHDKAFLYRYLEQENPDSTITDPRIEVYQPWNRFLRQYDGRRYWSSVFFYSHHQLLLIPHLARITSRFSIIRIKKEHHELLLRCRIRLSEKEIARYRALANENDMLVQLLTALETKYLPPLRAAIGFARYSGKNITEIIRYYRRHNIQTTLKKVGWSAAQVRNAAQTLLFTANQIDPLGDWQELVRLCHPDKWNKLRGDALLAIDYRMAAEILLQFYDELVIKGLAIPQGDQHIIFEGPFNTRLRSKSRDLDEILADFGLSPHPAVVLILEGDTELLLVPRVMELLGIPERRGFIEIFNGRGANSDFGLLARYISTPHLGEELEDSITLTKPPTHFLVALDADKGMHTDVARKKLRLRWVKRIIETIPKKYRTYQFQKDLEHLVSIETWNDTVFEFAHFTDEEIAHAILGAYTASNAPPETELVKEVKKMRNSESRNIDKILHHPRFGWVHQISKIELAEALWPVLKDRIESSDRKQLQEIPIVRILLKAEGIAAKLPRSNVVIRH